MLLLPRVFRLKDLGLWLALGLILILTWPFLEQPACAVDSHFDLLKALVF